MKKIAFVLYFFMIMSFVIAQNTHVPVITMQEWHNGYISDMQYTSDSKYIFTQGISEAKLWDVKTGLLVRTFDEIEFEPAILANGNEFFYRKNYYHQNGDFRGCCLQRRNFETGERKFIQEIQEKTYATSSDGKYLAGVSFKNEVNFYDQTTLEKLFSIPTDCKCSDGFFSADSKYFFVKNIEDKTSKVLMLNLEEKKIERVFSFDEKVWKISLSADGKRIAFSFLGKEQDILIFSTKTGEIENRFNFGGSTDFAQFSNDGAKILFSYTDSAYKDFIEMFDLENQKQVYKIKVEDPEIVCFSPDKKTFALNLYETIQIRKTSDGTIFREIKNHSSLLKVNRTPKKDLIWLHKKGLDEWNASLLFNSNFDSIPFSDKISQYNFSEPAFFENGVYFLEWRKSEKKCALAKYDLKSQKCVYVFPLDKYYSYLVCSADGKIISYYDISEKVLYVHDVESNKILRKWELEDKAQEFTMSEDGRFVAFLSGEKYIVLEVSTGKGFQTDDFGVLDSGTFSPDGKFYANHSIKAGGVQIYSTEDFSKYLFLKDVLYACFAPDNNTMGVFSGDTGFIFDLQNRKILSQFDLFSIQTAFFSEDGKRLFAFSWSGKIACYDVATGALLATLNTDEKGNFVAYTPEGYFKGNDEGIKKFVHIVDGMNVFELGQFYETLYRPDIVAEKLAGEKIDENPLKTLFDSGNAPIVEFAQLPVSSEKREIEVSFSVTDSGGGIGNVYFSHNGRVVQISKESNRKNGNLFVSFKCVLDNGENTLQAYASNASGKIESLRALTSIQWNGKTEPPNLFVLALGVNEYASEKVNDLKYAVPDMTAVVDSFKKSSGGLYEKVGVLALSDSEVTKNNVSHAFDTLSSIVKSDDVFVLYISGHGSAVNGEYYFIPHDFSMEKGMNTGISKHYLVENMSKLLAKKTIIMLDTCNSGAFIKSSNKIARKSLPKIQVAQVFDRGFETFGQIEEKTAVERLAHASGQIIITASTDSQFAVEGYRGHGIFTYCVLEALAGAADLNENGVSVKELLDYVETKVPQTAQRWLGYKQTPWSFFQGVDFDLVLYGNDFSGESSEIKVDFSANPQSRYSCFWKND